MTIYLVGKLQPQDSFGTNRLLLYAVFKTKVLAEDWVQKFAETHYTNRPHLCPMVIKEITVE